jgi:ferredoxin
MITKKILLHFSQEVVEKPIVYHLVKDYDLVINIFRAKITPQEEGYLMLDVSGSEENIRRGMEFVESCKVQINEAERGLRWEEARCTHCGNCLPHCPTGALHLADSDSRRVDFDINLCVECLSCVANCPFKACSSIF